MAECWVGVGANEGNVLHGFAALWNELRLVSDLQLGRRSGIYQTAPVGVHSGGLFSNAVFSLKTALPPLQLLELLQSIETRLGRQRSVRWGPRSMDLDLLSMGSLILSTERLTLPHPGVTYRRFVLDPLVEIAADWRHPCFQHTALDLRDRLLKRPLRISGDDLPYLQDSPEFQVVSSRDATSADLWVCLTAESLATAPPDLVTADLSRNPGSPAERLNDALRAALDRPLRIREWPDSVDDSQ